MLSEDTRESYKIALDLTEPITREALQEAARNAWPLERLALDAGQTLACAKERASEEGIKLDRMWRGNHQRRDVVWGALVLWRAGGQSLAQVSRTTGVAATTLRKLVARMGYGDQRALAGPYIAARNIERAERKRANTVRRAKRLIKRREKQGHARPLASEVARELGVSCSYVGDLAAAGEIRVAQREHGWLKLLGPMSEAAKLAPHLRPSLQQFADEHGVAQWEAQYVQRMLGIRWGETVEERASRITAYQEAHPRASQLEIQRALGVSQHALQRYADRGLIKRTWRNYSPASLARVRRRIVEAAKLAPHLRPQLKQIAAQCKAPLHQAHLVVRELGLVWQETVAERVARIKAHQMAAPSLSLGELAALAGVRKTLLLKYAGEGRITASWSKATRRCQMDSGASEEPDDG